MSGRDTGRRLLGAVLAPVLLLVPVACGGDGDGYCGALEADQETFSEMQQDTSGTALLRELPMLHRLADKAPEDLTDEWQTLLGALEAFSRTLDEVGVDPGDFEGGRPPAGLSAADRDRVAQAAGQLSDADVVEAANGIEQQARDVCKVQIGL